MRAPSEKFSETLRDHWIALSVFLLALLLTLGMYGFEKRQNMRTNQQAFDQTSRVVKDGLTRTMEDQVHLMRGARGLFLASADVTRDEFRDYVAAQNLSENFKGLYAMGFAPLISGRTELDIFEARVRDTDLPDYQVRPPADRPLYAPVLFVEPMIETNLPALGFDLMANPDRATAVDRAVRAELPSLSARLTLVTEPDGDGAQPGIILILPVFSGDPDGAAHGVLISAFRLGDLMNSVLSDVAGDLGNHLSVSLYDAPEIDRDRIMFRTAGFDAEIQRDAHYRFEDTFELYGRVWTFEAVSTEMFEQTIERNSHRYILWLGLLSVGLFSTLALAEVRRTRESTVAAQAVAESKFRIEMLLQEVNHRSKNLLALVQAIARQSSAMDVKGFQESFSKRIQAMATNQDLLVRSEWRRVYLSQLVSSQMDLFGNLVGARILINGPEIELSSSASQTIGMALHELTTNAVKYGALSNDIGQVHIDWRTFEGPEGKEQFELCWSEVDGPEVTPPTSTGFGSSVTGRMVSLGLEGDVDVNYARTGLVWTLTCHRAKLHTGVPKT